MNSMIIFGGTKGIGHGLARYYAAKGFQVTIAGRHPSTSSQSFQIHRIKADVTHVKNVQAVFKAHVKKWGKSADVVINCAAIQGPIGKSWEIPPKQMEETLKINLLGSMRVCCEAINHMKRSKKGCIIVFSGGGSAYARAFFNAYGTSKTGVLRMVETLADELTSSGYPEIRINALAPGAVKTDMTQEVLKAGKRAGKKALDEAARIMENGGTPLDEIADLVDFLMDTKNNNLSGRLIHVREEYRTFNKKISDDAGKLRRIPFKS